MSDAPDAPRDTDAGAADDGTVERLIAEWYATGICSAACLQAITREVERVAASVVRTYSPRIADLVRDNAVADIERKLRRCVEGADSQSRYDPRQPFAGWCYVVLSREAINCYRRKWHKCEKLLKPGTAGDDPFQRFAAQPRDEQPPADERAAIAAKMLAEFTRQLPRAKDRIIIAVQSGYIEGLPDAVVAAWCAEDGVTTSVAALREIAGTHGPLKALATVLGISHEDIRVRASRAKKRLAAADFSRAREELT